jgi:two-component system OmpR family response regulator
VTVTLSHSYRPPIASPTRDVTASGNDAGPLTVTLTLTLSGPAAAETAHHLVNALADSSPALSGSSVLDGIVIEPTSVAEPHIPASIDAPVVIDTVSRTILVDGGASRFTRREYDLLLFLADHAGAAFTRRQLLRAVWGHEFSGERTVDVHIRRVRAKLGGKGPTISTVHGFGYRLEDVEQVAVWRG